MYKPIGWWYHKILCELGWKIRNFPALLGWRIYYKHLNKMCRKYNINLYGMKIIHTNEMEYDTATKKRKA